MAKLTPDATRTEHGLVINEKIIPWGAVWPKDSGAYKKGAQYKADRLLSGGTGKVKGVTIHNTADLKNVEEDAEQYTRATWPTLELWEYIPQTITAKSGSSSGSGKSGGGAASNLKAGYKSYLSNERGKSPARDDADATAAMNKVTAMPY